MARRSVAKEKESMALFPELARYQSAEEKIAKQDDMVAGFAESFRADAARKWREARKALNTLEPITRAGLLRWWQSETNHMPREPYRLADCIHGIKQRGESYWRRLRINLQFRLIREGKLDRSVIQAIRAWD